MPRDSAHTISILKPVKLENPLREFTNSRAIAIFKSIKGS
jgi:hypothetical protein